MTVWEVFGMAYLAIGALLVAAVLPEAVESYRGPGRDVVWTWLPAALFVVIVWPYPLLQILFGVDRDG